MTTSTPGIGERTTASHKAVFVLAAASLLFGWHPLVSTFSLSLSNDAYTHILLIVPISATLIYLEWPTLRPLARPKLLPGAITIAIAFVAAGIAVASAKVPADIRLSLRMFALVLFWIGSFILCFGSVVTRRLIFPLCFLFWLIPFPQFLLARIVDWLQRGSAVSAEVLFSLVGVPVSRDGIILAIPGLAVEVAQECSSIRSSMMLIVTSMLLAQVLLRSPWKKALVIALAAPLSVAKNGLRIFTIAMLGTHVDPGYLNGRLHHDGGAIFLGIAIACVFGIIWILQRTERREAVRGAIA